MNILKAALSRGEGGQELVASLSWGFFFSQPAILWAVAAVHPWAGGRWRGHSSSPGISRGTSVVESIPWSYEKEEREWSGGRKEKEFFLF